MTPDELRAWREEPDIGQSELASVLEIHAHTVRKWEPGINRPLWRRT
jgi:DNA-binding transcriptional regulator YiaG